jgi:ribosomal protein S6
LNRLMKISEDVLRQMILIHEKPAVGTIEAPAPAAPAEATPAPAAATE